MIDHESLRISRMKVKFIFKHIQKIKEVTFLAYKFFQFLRSPSFRTYQKGNNILGSIETNTWNKHINPWTIEPTDQYLLHLIQVWCMPNYLLQTQNHTNQPTTHFITKRFMVLKLSYVLSWNYYKHAQTNYSSVLMA